MGGEMEVKGRRVEGEGRWEGRGGERASGVRHLSICPSFHLIFPHFITFSGKLH